ncbi:MAG: type II secretion system protein J [Lachnospiraceae bacterium]
MEKRIEHNKGFTLIELLIAMALLSIVMVMVVQFMSNTSGAYRKTKKNLAVQTEASEVMNQISDTLVQATYIRVSIDGDECYIIKKSEQSKQNKRSITKDTAGIDCDFVPDNYGNYASTGSVFDTTRKTVVNFDTYELVSAKKGEGNYPLTTDADYHSTDKVVRSFRMLRKGDNVSGDIASGDVESPYRYVIPKYLYVEYASPTFGNTMHVLYYFVKQKDGKHYSIYMDRYETADGDLTKGFNYAKNALKTKLGGLDADSISKDAEGLLTKIVSDFYLSADVDGNAILTNVLFESSGYQYNTVETINLRNSNVLSVRPQKLLGTDVSPSSSASSAP